MSYQKGELRVLTKADLARIKACDPESDEYWDLIAETDCDSRVVRDAIKDGLDSVVCLPHCCDEWVIGGPDEVRALIEDLQAALAKMGSTH